MAGFGFGGLQAMGPEARQWMMMNMLGGFGQGALQANQRGMGLGQGIAQGLVGATQQGMNSFGQAMAMEELAKKKQEEEAMRQVGARAASRLKPQTDYIVSPNASDELRADTERLRTDMGPVNDARDMLQSGSPGMIRAGLALSGDINERDERRRTRAEDMSVRRQERQEDMDFRRGMAADQMALQRENMAADNARADAQLGLSRQQEARQGDYQRQMLEIYKQRQAEGSGAQFIASSKAEVLRELMENGGQMTPELEAKVKSLEVISQIGERGAQGPGMLEQARQDYVRGTASPEQSDLIDPSGQMRETARTRFAEQAAEARDLTDPNPPTIVERDPIVEELMAKFGGAIPDDPDAGQSINQRMPPRDPRAGFNGPVQPPGPGQTGPRMVPFNGVPHIVVGNDPQGGMLLRNPQTGQTFRVPAQDMRQETRPVQ